MKPSTVMSWALAAVPPAVLGTVGGLLWRSDNPGSFWLGNLSAPYLLVPFLSAAIAVGSNRSSRPSTHLGRTTGTSPAGRATLGAAIGAASDLTAIGIFYAITQYGTIAAGNPTMAGLHRYGPLAVVAGAVFGALGSSYRTRLGFVSGVVTSVPFLLEAAAWHAHLGYTPNPAWVWTDERLTGVALLVALVGISLLLRRRT